MKAQEDGGLFGTVLLVKKKGMVKGRLELDNPICTFGRADSCDVRIQLDSVSRRHGRLEVSSDGSHAFVVCESNNGMLVNGRRLRHGDRHLLGPEETINIQERYFRFLPRSQETPEPISPATVEESSYTTKETRTGRTAVGTDVEVAPTPTVETLNQAAVIEPVQAARPADADARVQSPVKPAMDAISATPVAKASKPISREVSPKKDTNLPKTPSHISSRPSPTRLILSTLTPSNLTPSKVTSSRRSSPIKLSQEAEIADQAPAVIELGTPAHGPALNTPGSRKTAISSSRVATPAKHLVEPMSTPLPVQHAVTSTPVAAIKSIKASRLLVNSGGPRRIATTTPAKRYITAHPFTAPRSFQARLTGAPRRPQHALSKSIEAVVVDKALIEDAKIAHEEFIAVAQDIASTENTPSRVIVSQSCVHPALLAGSPAQQALKDPQTPADLSSIQNMIEALTIAPTPRFDGMRRLFAEQQSTSSWGVDLVDSKHLLKTPKQARTPRFAGLKELLAEPAIAQTPGYTGVRKLLAEPVVAQTPRFAGVRELLAEPTVSHTPRFAGMKELLLEAKVAQTPRLSGVREMFAERPEVKAPSLAGVKELLRQAKAAQSPNFTGMESLLSERQSPRTPRPPYVLESPTLTTMTPSQAIRQEAPSHEDLTGVTVADNQDDAEDDSPSNADRVDEDQEEVSGQDVSPALSTLDTPLSIAASTPSSTVTKELIDRRLTSAGSAKKRYVVRTPAKGSITSRKSIANMQSSLMWDNLHLAERPHTTRKERAIWDGAFAAEGKDDDTHDHPSNAQEIAAEYASPNSPVTAVDKQPPTKDNSPSKATAYSEPFALGSFSPLRSRQAEEVSSMMSESPPRSPMRQNIASVQRSTLRQEMHTIPMASPERKPLRQNGASLLTNSAQPSPLRQEMRTVLTPATYQSPRRDEISDEPAASPPQNPSVQVEEIHQQSPLRTETLVKKSPQRSPLRPVSSSSVDVASEKDELAIQSAAIETVAEQPLKKARTPANILQSRVVPSSLPVRSTRIRASATRPVQEDETTIKPAPASEPTATAKVATRGLVEPKSRGKENIPRRRAVAVKTEQADEIPSMMPTRSLRSRAR